MMGTSLFPENKVARPGIDHPPLSLLPFWDFMPCSKVILPIGFMLETRYSNANFQDKLICFPDVVLDSVFSLEGLLCIRTDVTI